MTEVPVSPSKLHKVAEGRLGLAASILDPRFWRAVVVDNGAFGLAVAGVLIAAFLIEMANGGPMVWGLSSRSLAEGRWWTVGSHMIAHAGVVHLLMNLSGLLPFSAVLSRRFGRGAEAWGTQAALFLLSGLAGAAIFLLLNTEGTVPMVGASGAICGLWGAVARIRPDGEIAALRSRQVWKQVWEFAKLNLVLFAILLFFARINGGSGGLAWEAHLGGFLIGFLILPFMAPPVPPTFKREANQTESDEAS